MSALLWEILWGVSGIFLGCAAMLFIVVVRYLRRYSVRTWRECLLKREEVMR